MVSPLLCLSAKNRYVLIVEYCYKELCQNFCSLHAQCNLKYAIISIILINYSMPSAIFFVYPDMLEFIPSVHYIIKDEVLHPWEMEAS